MEEGGRDKKEEENDKEKEWKEAKGGASGGEGRVA